MILIQQLVHGASQQAVPFKVGKNPTSEESNGGSVYQVDPNESTTSPDYCRVPIVPEEGGRYESTYSGNFLLITNIISTQQRILN